MIPGNQMQKAAGYRVLLNTERARCQHVFIRHIEGMSSPRKDTRRLSQPGSQRQRLYEGLHLPPY